MRAGGGVLRGKSHTALQAFHCRGRFRIEVHERSGRHAAGCEAARQPEACATATTGKSQSDDGGHRIKSTIAPLPRPDAFFHQIRTITWICTEVYRLTKSLCHKYVFFSTSTSIVGSFYVIFSPHNLASKTPPLSKKAPYRNTMVSIIAHAPPLRRGSAQIGPVNLFLGKNNSHQT